MQSCQGGQGQKDSCTPQQRRDHARRTESLFTPFASRFPNKTPNLYTSLCGCFFFYFPDSEVCPPSSLITLTSLIPMGKACPDLLPVTLGTESLQAFVWLHFKITVCPGSPGSFFDSMLHCFISMSDPSYHHVPQGIAAFSI